MLVPFLLLLCVALLLCFEAVVVRRRVSSIVHRVHVNGTRGKSSVTAYIAAGMRGTGHRTWGKITGIIPTCLLPDSSRVEIKRRGPARVQEQFSIIGRAARDKAECLVLECMSLQPELQSLEGRHFRPSVYVLTNVKDDHREVLGDSLAEQTRAICEAAAPGATIVTTSGAHMDILNEIATSRGDRVVVAERLSESQRASIPAGVFSENIELALTACRECGTDPDRAMTAIMAEAEKRADYGPSGAEGAIRFVDGFAVNDVQSADDFIAQWRSRIGESVRFVVLFNARADRPLRSASFAGYLPTLSNLDRVIVFGSHASYMTSALRKAGLAAGRVTRWNKHDIVRPEQRLKELGVSSQHLVMGLGNIGGDGHAVARALDNGARHVV